MFLINVFFDMAFWRNFSSLSLLLIFTYCASADPVLLVTEHLPPYQIAEQESVTGSAVEITKAVFHNADIDYEMAVFPWSDAYRIAQRKPETCIFSTSRIPERESAFAWIGQINSLNTTLYRSVDDDFTVNSLEEVKNYKVAAIKDDVTHHFLLSKGFEENKNLYVLQAYDSLVDLLDRKNRHIDFVVLTPEILEYRVQDKRKLSRYQEVLQVKELVLYHYLACNIYIEPTRVEKLKASFAELEARGDLQSIRNEWGIDSMQAWVGRDSKITNLSASPHHQVR